MTVVELLDALVQPALLSAVPSLPEAVGSATVAAVAYDSRRAVPGSVFVALRGQKDDGARFAPQAVARGAVLVVADSPAPGGHQGAWLQVPDARLALALLADRFYQHPSGVLDVIGITGTNGKTTTAYLLRSILEASGQRCGVLGTVVYNLGREDREATRTTPEAPDVQQMFAEMLENGCKAAVMEVSSHALALKRVDGVHFAAGVFSNLTRDHLDFHGDMETYFAAKRRLFEMLPQGAPGVVNLDDPRGQLLAGTVQRLVTYGMRNAADVTPEPFDYALSGLRFTARTPRGALQVKSSLVGQPNVYNLLAAIATADALGVPHAAIESGIERLPGVPGRFEVVSQPSDDIGVVVDYAHTDDALKNLLETARTLSPGRLITVFGCGGDRDRTKRPLMGAVGGRLSDVLIVTSDNPRTEDPAAIIDEVLRGIPGGVDRASSRPSRPGTRAPEVLAIVDRRDAVTKAIDLARTGDLVIVAGKGHETTQVIGDRALPFDDVAVSRDALTRRRTRQRVG
jgi:UDP-N-acetylmuramoyl-L-alanyl-D-glutamate--2,6-diaminopimelate ligase